jgi:G:T-mismatch repair DNA endonuclease (very short patch repair protein)
VIFVHGCFWHRHKGCKDATTPKSNKALWRKKFDRNVANDKKHTRDLKKLGWKVVTVWECQLKKPAAVFQRLDLRYSERVFGIPQKKLPRRKRQNSLAATETKVRWAPRIRGNEVAKRHKNRKS